MPFFVRFVPKSVQKCDRTSHAWKRAARTHISHTFQNGFCTHTHTCDRTSHVCVCARTFATLTLHFRLFCKYYAFELFWKKINKHIFRYESILIWVLIPKNVSKGCVFFLLVVFCTSYSRTARQKEPFQKLITYEHDEK